MGRSHLLQSLFNPALTTYRRTTLSADQALETRSRLRRDVPILATEPMPAEHVAPLTRQQRKSSVNEVLTNPCEPRRTRHS